MLVSDGDRWIAAQNIQQFLAKLDEEQDEKKRRTLRDLLERERAKLLALNGQKPG